MKRILSVFLSLVILCLFAGCQSNEFSDDKSSDLKSDPVIEDELDVFEYEQVSGGLEITKYTGSNKKVVVPEMIDNKKVVSVGTVFSGNLSIEEVELPPSVKEADFENCEALKRLEAKGISSFSKVKLSGCESLEYLALPAITNLQNYSFKLPGSIRELILSGVTEIYVYRFPDELESLEVLDISSATLIIRDYHSWPSKLKEVRINNSISHYYISDDTNSVGGVRVGTDDWEGTLTEVNVNNNSMVWCELFDCEEIKVNGVTHKKS